MLLLLFYISFYKIKNTKNNIIIILININLIQTIIFILLQLKSDQASNLCFGSY